MEPSPDLLSTPNEILASISTFAVDDRDSIGTLRRGKKWLRAVRLARKQLYSSATTVFGQRFLTRCSVIATRDSLETLLEVCTHPVIGPLIHDIVLYGGRLDQELVAPLRRDLESSLRRGDLQRVRQARRRLRSFMDVLEEELELDQHVGIFQLLVNALRAIQDNGRSVSLTVFTLRIATCSTHLESGSLSKNSQRISVSHLCKHSVARALDLRAIYYWPQQPRVVAGHLNSNWQFKNPGSEMLPRRRRQATS
jgi:hypothetical protein